MNCKQSVSVAKNMIEEYGQDGIISTDFDKFQKEHTSDEILPSLTLDERTVYLKMVLSSNSNTLFELLHQTQRYLLQNVFDEIDHNHRNIYGAIVHASRELAKIQPSFTLADSIDKLSLNNSEKQKIKDGCFREIVTEAQSIINDENKTWKEKFDEVFSDNISTQINSLNIPYNWVDMDTSYEEDVRSYVRGLQDTLEFLN